MVIDVQHSLVLHKRNIVQQFSNCCCSLDHLPWQVSDYGEHHISANHWSTLSLVKCI